MSASKHSEARLSDELEEGEIQDSCSRVSPLKNNPGNKAERADSVQNPEDGEENQSGDHQDIAAS